MAQHRRVGQQETVIHGDGRQIGQLRPRATRGWQRRSSLLSGRRWLVDRGGGRQRMAAASVRRMVLVLSVSSGNHGCKDACRKGETGKNAQGVSADRSGAAVRP